MSDAQREAERLMMLFDDVCWGNKEKCALICIDEMLMVCMDGERSFLEEVKRLIIEL